MPPEFLIYDNIINYVQNEKSQEFLSPIPFEFFEIANIFLKE